MGYGVLGSMGYGFEFPAYRLGGSEILWVMGEYGLSELWVMRELTLLTICGLPRFVTVRTSDE